MITLFRMVRLWQLRTKWSLALWQFADKELTALIKSPEDLEKKFIEEFAKLIHEDNKLNGIGKEVFNVINQKINS